MRECVMSILNFELSGCTRLSLRNIKTVKMTPAQKLQMILGTNGSGKSSLLHELSPIASKPANFERGGYKKITLHRKNSVYECMSDFTGPKNRFYLAQDSKVLYEGHSSEMYNSLVAQYLKETPEVHAIRTGNRRLTTMDTDARRKWITKLCPQDYSYAIGYYKRLGEATRDLSGAIKRINTKLMQEKAKLIDEDMVIQLTNEINELNKQRLEMMQYWRPRSESFETIMQKIRMIDQDLQHQSTAVATSLKSYSNTPGFQDTTQVWTKLSELQAQKAVIENETSVLFEQIEEIYSNLRQAQDASVKDVSQLNSELAEIARGLMSLSDNSDWGNTGEMALASYDGIYGPFSAILDELEPDPELKYSKENYHDRKEQHKVLTLHIAELEKISRALSEKKSVMLHQKEQNHTECPKCQHVWSKGYDEAIYKDVCERLDENQSRLTEANQKETELFEFLEKAARQLQLLDRLSGIAMSTPLLGPIWTSLISSKMVRTNPRGALEMFKQGRGDIMNAIEYKRLNDQKKELTEAKELAQKMSGVNQQELITKKELIEAELLTKQNLNRELTIQIDSLKTIIKNMELHQNFVLKANDALSKRNQLIHDAELANQHEAINEIVMHLDMIINSKQKLISQIDTQKGIIASLENEVKEYVTKEAAMKAAMKSLSPATGLIARGLTGFINHFIAQMNAIIEKVWLYPLEIQPIAMDDDKLSLDYDFAFTVDGKKAGDDVDQGSGAQKEIFDLAFMLVSMIHLGLQDTEIFLDEFSIKMDYAHRKEAMKMVMDLLNNSDFSQIYMISHYESSYGTLSNADITVLCPENILLPSDLKYNTHSEIVT